MVEGAPPAEADPAVRPLRPTNRRFFCVAVEAAAESSDEDDADDAVTTSATEAGVDVGAASPECAVVVLSVVLSCSISFSFIN